eukprot:10151564-Alexandrium_andersonii.AAC.1
MQSPHGGVVVHQGVHSECMRLAGNWCVLNCSQGFKINANAQYICASASKRYSPFCLRCGAPPAWGRQGSRCHASMRWSSKRWASRSCAVGGRRCGAR